MLKKLVGFILTGFFIIIVAALAMLLNSMRTSNNIQTQLYGW